MIGPLLLGVMLQSSTEAQLHVNYRLTKIDQQMTRVTPYFGFQAPKIVFDGDAYYSIGHWGDQPYPEPASGCIYKSKGGRWVKVTGFMNAIAAYFSRRTPIWLVTRVTGWVMKPSKRALSA